MVIVTRAERKAARVDAIEAAVAELRRTLAAFARTHGGRFVLYGSASRGELRFDSDVDLLVDLADVKAGSAAWTFAEQECARLNVEGDIQPLAACSARFLDHIRPDARFLP